MGPYTARQNEGAPGGRFSPRREPAFRRDVATPGAKDLAVIATSRHLPDGFL
jgi:hypothetical protein